MIRTEHSTTNLIEEAKHLQPEAYEKIWARYVPLMTKYGMSLCQDLGRVEEVIADVFATMIEHIVGGGGPKRNLKAYLMNGVRNGIIKHTKGRKNLMDSLDDTEYAYDQIPDYQLPIEEQIMERESHAELWQSLNNLLESRRQVVILRFLEDYTLKEAADIVGITVNNVKVLEHRGVQNLREKLEPSDFL